MSQDEVENPEFESPLLTLWFLRCMGDQEINYWFKHNPLLFAVWFSFMQSGFPWPDSIKTAIETNDPGDLQQKDLERFAQAFMLSPDAMKNMDVVKRIAIGHAIHNEFVKDFAQITSMCRRINSDLGRRMEAGKSTKFPQNVLTMSEILGWDDLETEIFTFAFMCSASSEMVSFFLNMEKMIEDPDALWSAVFDHEYAKIEACVSHKSKMRESGLIKPMMSSSTMPSISTFWARKILSKKDIREIFVTPFKISSAFMAPGRLLKEDLPIIQDLLNKQRTDESVNVLLWGNNVLEMGHIIGQIQKISGREIYTIPKIDDASSQDYSSIVYLARAMVDQYNESKPSLLYVDRAAMALRSNPDEFMVTFFGAKLIDDEEKSLQIKLLDSNKAPALWLFVGPMRLPTETIAQFTFHCALQKATKSERVEALKSSIEQLKLGEEMHEKIVRLEGLSQAQLLSADRLAKMIVPVAENASQEDMARREELIYTSIKRSQKAMGRETHAKARNPVTKYSVDLINTRGRFTPDDILRSLQRNPKGSLILYGLPGTGKTQFVEYLASKLGLPLISKRASDLLSKWMGETEKNIALAFEEAADNEAILFLDEGDSFLRDRNQARDGHEITKVNEMLQHIERFEGIVVIATNLFKGLDQAALRRFTHKLNFLPLDDGQRWNMFVSEAGITEVEEDQSGNWLENITSKKSDATVMEHINKNAVDWSKKLQSMKNLTAGDFATVKRQAIMLGHNLSPEDWLSQLQIEVDLKDSDEYSK